jgi:carboxymethylenebutenolidase
MAAKSTHMKQAFTPTVVIALTFTIFIALVASFLILKPKPQSNVLKASVFPNPTNISVLISNRDTKIKSEEVNYFNDINGYYSVPVADGNHPGIVLIHESWGLNENIKSIARELSKEGFQVLAVDLFKGSTTTTQENAQAQVSAINQDEALENLTAAMNFLKEINAQKIASFGLGFGGDQSMQLSLSSQDLSGTIIYYGNITAEEDELSSINWPVLGIFAGDDTSIPTEIVNQFETALNNLDIENNINTYPGVGHAFANPNADNYSPEVSRSAWIKTLDFLNRNLKQI